MATNWCFSPSIKTKSQFPVTNCMLWWRLLKIRTNFQIIAEKSLNFEYEEFLEDLASSHFKKLFLQWQKVCSIDAWLSGEMEIVCVVTLNNLKYKKICLKILWTAALLLCWTIFENEKCRFFEKVKIERFSDLKVLETLHTITKILQNPKKYDFPHSNGYQRGSVWPCKYHWLRTDVLVHR